MQFDRIVVNQTTMILILFAFKSENSLFVDSHIVYKKEKF